MLKTRIITASFLMALLLLNLFLLPSIWFAAFVGLVLMLAAWEWSNLAGFDGYFQRFVYCSVSAGLVVLLGVYLTTLPSILLDADKVLSILLLAGAWWAIALLWVQGYPSSVVLWGNRWIRAAMGIVVLIPSGLSLVFLHHQPQGAWLILLVVFVVATADVGAYFSGKAFGRRKLAEKVSPNKSWEGVWGGLVACIVLSLVVAAVIGIKNWPVLALIMVPAALVSILGDLLESMLKRHRGIKDSGHILPGHGGVLDRIDGLTAAAPVFAIAFILSGWQLP